MYFPLRGVAHEEIIIENIINNDIDKNNLKFFNLSIIIAF
jgi:hypothetical protein